MPQMNFEESQELAEEYGIPTPEAIVVDTKKALKETLRGFDSPVAMKLMSPDVVHKSDVDGVVLDVETQKEALEVFTRFRETCDEEGFEFTGAMVQEQVDGRYVLVGLKRDPQFGPVVVFGLGGIFVEIMEDVTFRVCPLEEQEVDDMIEDIRGYPILRGVRGDDPVDMESIKEVISAVCRIGMEEDDVEELDINPLVVSPGGAWAVDFRVIV